MRALVLVAAFSLTALSLVALAPTANAFTWCTIVGPDGHQCREHVACVGWSWGPGYERCQYGVPDVCLYWNCYPQP